MITLLLLRLGQTTLTINVNMYYVYYALIIFVNVFKCRNTKLVTSNLIDKHY